MTTTYTLIEKITVGAAGASSIEFTSIPQTYTDLVIKLSLRDNQSGSTGNDTTINFNGSATSFTGRRIYGNGATISNDTVAPYAGSSTSAGTTASTFSNTEIYIPNYTSANNKSFTIDSTVENNATTAYAILYAGLWSNTAAITSVKIVRPSTYDLVQYSTAYLYGVAKEGVNPSTSSAPYATGGDKILYDGTYWYHAFTSSGTFTPKKGLSCDILVVAGGGGGGQDNGGGGGAGGLLAHTAQALTNGTGYTVTIGSGGAGATTATRGSTGSNSQFGSLTASSGGGGGGYFNTGLTGGSGGGGAPSNNAGGAGTSGQGNAGGSGGATYSGGGGGGSGATGSNGSGSVGGAGGIGSSSYSSWGSATSTGENVSGTYYFAGGGGGGTEGAGSVQSNGGSGGGGKGGRVLSGGTSPLNATSGTANTGGGGGGGQGNSGNGAAGGSGIVIVRYAA